MIRSFSTNDAQCYPNTLDYVRYSLLKYIVSDKMYYTLEYADDWKLASFYFDIFSTDRPTFIGQAKGMRSHLQRHTQTEVEIVIIVCCSYGANKKTSPKLHLAIFKFNSQITI